MILNMQDICKDYQMGRSSVLHVLKHVNLTVNEGDYIAIMGPSGSGKSTLMNIIGCLDVPTSGTYNLEGNDIGRCTDNKLAELRNRYIGFVFQSFHLMLLSPQKNQRSYFTLAHSYSQVFLHLMPDHPVLIAVRIIRAALEVPLH